MNPIPSCIEGTRFRKIYCCSLGVNFIYQFVPQFALASSEHQMLSARCFLFFLIVPVYFVSQRLESLLALFSLLVEDFSFSPCEGALRILSVIYSLIKHQNFSCIKQVDKGRFITVKDLES